MNHNNKLKLWLKVGQMKTKSIYVSNTELIEIPELLGKLYLNLVTDKFTKPKPQLNQRSNQINISRNI